MKKRKLGIVGGMGARAGANFLQNVINYSPALRDQDFIEIILHSNACIPDRTKAIVYGEKSPLEEITRSVSLLEAAGADVIALACITSYHYYDGFARGACAAIPHPVEAVASYLNEWHGGIKRVGLLATTGTLQGGIFEPILRKYGFEIVALKAPDQEAYFMKALYMERGLKSANISAEARSLLLQTVPKLLDQGAEAIIGGCSEVPLVLHQALVPVPLIDAMDALARQVVAYCYQMQPVGAAHW